MFIGRRVLQSAGVVFGCWDIGILALLISRKTSHANCILFRRQKRGCSAKEVQTTSMFLCNDISPVDRARARAYAGFATHPLEVGRDQARHRLHVHEVALSSPGQTAR